MLKGFMKLSTQTKVGIGFILSIGLLLSMAVVAYNRTQEFLSYREKMADTQAILSELETLLSNVKDAETGHRGYTITRESRFLEPYFAAMTQIEPSLKRLEELLERHSDQRESFKALDEEITRRLRLIDEGIDLVNQPGPQGKEVIVSVTLGKQSMDRLRGMVGEMQNTQRTRMEAAGREAEAGGGVAFFSFAALIFFQVALLGVLFWIISRDMKLRRLAEQEIRRLAMIAKKTHHGVVLLDGQARVEWVNEGFRQITNLGLEDVRKRTLAAVLGQVGVQEKVQGRLAEAFDKREVFEAEFSGGMPRSRMFWAALAVSPFFDGEERLEGYVGLLRDVSVQKRMEEELRMARDSALESARLKSEFLANMSHEIRTPMNGIVGMTGLLLDTNLSSEQKEFAETVRGCADSLLTIINDILDFSKIEAGKLRFEVADFNLQAVVEETVELLAVRAASKQLELAAIFSQEVPRLLRGDAGRVRQILNNLVGNAIKFTRQGEVVVKVELKHETDSHALVQVAVSDTGIGISEEGQRHLFQPFVQVDGSSTKVYGGTGLGLAISQQLAELMGGQISVMSSPGQGSVFTLTVLFEKQGGQVNPAEAAPSGLKGLRVLVVDDNETNRRVLHFQLNAWECQEFSARSAEEALAILRRQNELGEGIDLAILDFFMPGVDGLELAGLIRAEAGILQPRLMILSSLGQRLDREVLAALDIRASLNKPIKQSQLYECLREILGPGLEKKRSLIDTAPPRPVVEDGISREAWGKLIKEKQRILVAEDNGVNQRLALYQLKKFGFNADAVASGREAVQAWQKPGYDLIFMDCQMPEVDGYQATREIRLLEKASGRGRTVIVAMTANALQGDRERCLEAGMDDYLSKPVRLKEVERVLRAWLGRKSETES